MGRPEGTRNPGYDAKRAQLAEKAVERLVEEGPLPSFRELAAAAEVSVPTLRHYFGDRDGLIAAAFEQMLRMGAPHTRAAADATRGDARSSLRWLLGSVLSGWREFGVGKFFGVGLTLGLGHEHFGPKFLDTLLEPLLQATEARLTKHVAWGELAVDDIRAAAIQLVSPLFVALLHQDALGGAMCRELDVDAFVDNHVDMFVRAYGVARG